ncbi:MAG: MarR family transcriptional regulator [Proteobacteria bacterium]|nr:MarR family transcriptional regulator [Pseudomonadota bacterium]
MAQTPSPGAGPALDDLLLYRLSRLLSVGGSPVIRLCEGRFGITRREWRVLATLAEHGAKGLGSSQLAELAQLDRARTSRAVGSLAAKDLISRSQPGGDRRQVMLRLTDAGRAIHAELFPMVREINAQLMSALAPQAAQLFDESLARLQAQAEALLPAAADLPKADRRRRAPSGA